MGQNPKIITIANGKLEIKSINTGEILWTGKPYDLDVQDVISIPNTDDYIVVLDWHTAAIQYNKKNLMRISPVNRIIWEVGPPKEKTEIGFIRQNLEIYVSVQSLNTDFVIAYCLSGFVDKINVATGAIINSVFVK